MTGAITIALREKLDRERRERSVEALIQKLRAISKCCRSLLKDGPSAVEHGDFLYDESCSYEEVLKQYGRTGSAGEQESS